MVHCSQILRHPVRWLVQATLLGCLIGIGFGLARGYGRASVPACAAIGVIFTLVIWGGFDLVGAPRQASLPHWNPARIGLFTVAWIMAWYLVLLGVSLTLVRLLLRINLFRDRYMLVSSLLVGLAVSGIMVAKETVAQKVEADRKLARAEARAAFLSLQAQLQPHTLFNALNTIASLIHEDPKGAEEATERLSALLRRVLGALEQPEWPLSEEFSLLEDLLRLEELRFGPRLCFRLDLDPAMADRPVQPLLLLPLVENALKHGFRPKVGPCNLDVTARDGAVLIRDDGVGRAADAPEGLGLRTVRERLAVSGGRLSWPGGGPGCTVEVRF